MQFYNTEIRLNIIFFLLFALVQLLVATGQRGGDTIFDNLLLAVPALMAGVVGLASFFTGIISIEKSKERSVVVFLASAIGFVIPVFLLGAIIVPH